MKKKGQSTTAAVMDEFWMLKLAELEEKSNNTTYKT